MRTRDEPYAASRASELSFETRKAVSNDNIPLAYKVLGQGPLNLVFMHGWASTKDYFDETIASLDLGGLRAVAVDIRGHGESGYASAGFNCRQFARDLLSVADHAGIDEFVVLGHSMGAKYIQYLQLLEPARVIGQVLIAGMTAGTFDIPEDDVEKWLDRTGSVERWLESHHNIAYQPVPPDVSLRWAKSASRISRDVLKKTAWTFRYDSFTDQLYSSERPQPPTLVVAGSRDVFFSPEHLMDEVVVRIRGCRQVTLSCGHEIPLELPETLAGLIEAFVSGLGNRC